MSLEGAQEKAPLESASEELGWLPPGHATAQKVPDVLGIGRAWGGRPARLGEGGVRHDDNDT